MALTLNYVPKDTCFCRDPTKSILGFVVRTPNVVYLGFRVYAILGCETCVVYS